MIQNLVLDKEAPQIFYQRGVVVFVGTARGVDKKFEAKPTKSNGQVLNHFVYNKVIFLGCQIILFLIK